jgi:hypothetical protein
VVGERDKGVKDPELPPCMMYVDKEGAWFHKGAPIIHRELLVLFYQCIRLDEEGRYIIKFKDQVCRLDVEDTPFVILRTDFVPAGPDGEAERFVLHLIDHTKEDLVPESLSIGPDHVLYCKVKDKQFLARFSRPSYYQIAEYIHEEQSTDRYFLYLNKKKYYVKKLPKGSFAPKHH